MSFSKNQKKSFFIKACICFLTICILFGIAVIGYFRFAHIAPKGEYISKKEANVNLSLLETLCEKEDLPFSLEYLEETDEQSFVSYGEWRSLYDSLKNSFSSIDWAQIDTEKYREEDCVLKEDWYFALEQLLSPTFSQEEEFFQDILILGNGDTAQDADGIPLEQGFWFSTDGLFENKLDNFLEVLSIGSNRYLVYDQKIWGIRDTYESSEWVKNAFFIQKEVNQGIIFYKSYRIELPIKEDASLLQADTETKLLNQEDASIEQVCDILITKSGIQKVKYKDEKLHGKLLRVNAEELELQDMGTFPMSDSVQCYCLYGTLKTIPFSKLGVGYSFSDYVIEDGEIQACLLTRDEKMENIRVLLKNQDSSGYYHEKVIINGNVDCILSYGDQGEVIPAKENKEITLESSYFDGNSRIYMKPTALTGRITVKSIDRSIGKPSYRGELELQKTQDGILVVNEVLLEEYLYGVVPSEMPASYPEEALKAQAICARTYAYERMKTAGLASYGAHVDDSTGFQVYNNIAEQGNATTAVKETKGQLLFVDGELAKTYYYSTSCGFGADDSVWLREGESQIPYLQASALSSKEHSFTGKDLKNEDTFREWITNTWEDDYEKEESWYRWRYESSMPEKWIENIGIRKEKDSASILWRKKDTDQFVDTPLPEIHQIKDIQITSRGEGGIAREMSIVTDSCEVLVLKELNIRYILTDGKTSVLLQNGKKYACPNILPSAFFVIDTDTKNDQISRISIIGGGFGHGVGLSQNGAKNMANSGFDSHQILQFFYKNSTIEE